MACTGHVADPGVCTSHLNSCPAHSGYVPARTVTFTNVDVAVGEVIDAQNAITELLDELNAEATRRVSAGAAWGIGISSGNMINPNKDWVIGTSGTQGSFTANGQQAESRVVSGIGPFGETEAIWECLPDNTSSADGGWNHSPFSIDVNSRYVFGVYMKQKDTNGTKYLGCDVCQTLAGVANGNPYFWYGDLPQSNKWYLVLGVLHAQGTTTNIGLAGVYDAATGERVISGNEFRHDPTKTTQLHRCYHYYNTVGDLSTVYQWMARPFMVEYSKFPGVNKLTGLANTSGMVGETISLTLDNPIEAAEVKALRDLYSDITRKQIVNPFSDNEIGVGDIIRASTIETMKDGLVAEAATCACDCNYACTCDCNYACTCDCNYACTCDCNYACTCDCNYACTCDCNYACTCDCNYCTCDCNYCTCNCNYCTCNCNYSCTCNCNYSDERLKTNIIYF